MDLAVGWVMVALALLASLLVITMFAVPGANAFFRMEKPSQHLPDVPRVTNGSSALRDRLLTLGPRGRLVIVFWRAMLERGKRLVNGKSFLVLGIAALMIGALLANAAWSAFRTEISTDLAATAEEASVVGQCLPYVPKVERGWSTATLPKRTSRWCEDNPGSYRTAESVGFGLERRYDFLAGRSQTIGQGR